MTNSEPNIQRSTGLNAFKRVMKWLMLAMLFLLTIFFILNFALRITQVQNWVSKRVVKVINEDINGNVSLGEIRIKFPSDISLDDVLISSDGDTVIAASSIDINLLSGITSLIGGNANFDNIEITDAVVNVKRAEGAWVTNIDTIFQAIASPNDTMTSNGVSGTKQPVEFSAKHVILNNVRYINDDKAYGNHHDIFVPYGELSLESLDVLSNVLTLSRAYFKTPIAKMKTYPGVEPVYDGPEIHSDSIPPKLKIVAETMIVEDGIFEILNTKADKKELGPYQIDLNDMKLEEVQIEMADFSVRENDFYGSPSLISFKHPDGFILNGLA
ncbi:MAG: hypothetical protein KJP00_12820, partial [Bacteroidia bacterium]|nr:hypothetical protein [Bacteroidia bacterium]